jgi:hypothetical protein
MPPDYKILSEMSGSKNKEKRENFIMRGTNALFSKYYLTDRIKENNMVGAKGNEKYVQNDNREI